MDTFRDIAIGSLPSKLDTHKRKTKIPKFWSQPQETRPSWSGNSTKTQRSFQNSDNQSKALLDTLTSSVTWPWPTITTISSPHHGTKPWDFGTSELERPPEDSPKMDTPKKFCHVPFLQMEDISFHQELTNKSSSGTSRVTANTPSRTTTTAIGSQRLDSSKPQRTQLEDYSSPQSDGTDVLKSGTTKLSTSRIHSKPMTETSMPSPSHQEEISSSPVEKTKKWKFSISAMLRSQPQCTMLEPQWTVLPSTQEATGSQLVLRTDGKFGTSRPRTTQSLRKDNTKLKERRTSKKNKAKRLRLTNSTKSLLFLGTLWVTDFSSVSPTVSSKPSKSLSRNWTEMILYI